MADEYTWTHENSMERRCIERFLSTCQEYIKRNPNRVAFRREEGNVVINTLRGMLNKLPSEMGEGDANHGE